MDLSVNNVNRDKQRHTLAGGRLPACGFGIYLVTRRVKPGCTQASLRSDRTNRPGVFDLVYTRTGHSFGQLQEGGR